MYGAIMTNLLKDALDNLIELGLLSKDSATACQAIVAKQQLQVLLDDNYRKEARIVELEREIVDIHRHYGKRLGD